jgi:hypothetical protein
MREIQNLIYGVMESSGSALHEFDLLAGWMHGYKYSPSLISKYDNRITTSSHRQLIQYYYYRRSSRSIEMVSPRLIVVAILLVVTASNPTTTWARGAPRGLAGEGAAASASRRNRSRGRRRARSWGSCERRSRRQRRAINTS